MRPSSKREQRNLQRREENFQSMGRLARSLSYLNLTNKWSQGTSRRWMPRHLFVAVRYCTEYHVVIPYHTGT